MTEVPYMTAEQWAERFDAERATKAEQAELDAATAKEAALLSNNARVRMTRQRRSTSFRVDALTMVPWLTPRPSQPVAITHPGASAKPTGIIATDGGRAVEIDAGEVIGRDELHQPRRQRMIRGPEAILAAFETKFGITFRLSRSGHLEPYSLGGAMVAEIATAIAIVAPLLEAHLRDGSVACEGCASPAQTVSLGRAVLCLACVYGPDADPEDAAF